MVSRRSVPAEEGDTQQRYEELCSSLNMDERARSEAWLSYQNMKRNFTLEAILEQDVFHRSLLACCLEIITFTYKPPGNFPFILEIFDIPVYNFYKVIEVFIRAEDGLCREVVKHLNHIEEQILESMAWKQESILWDRIRDNENKVPACEEVMPPQYFERSAGNSVVGFPLTPRRINEFRTETGEPGKGIANENGGITFFPVQVNVGTQAQAVPGPIQPLSAQALTGTLNTQVMGAVLQLPSQVTVQQISPGEQRQTQPFATVMSIRSRKMGSLSLFFRKVYHLASVRLRDLCIKLDVSDELRKKIWTCFEYSLVHCPEIMMDRHLGQLPMCAIYIMAKVTKDHFRTLCAAIGHNHKPRVMYIGVS